MNTLVDYFARRGLLANVIFVATILMGAFIWVIIGKEEMPEFESNWVRITTLYPGAPAEDVELFVTRPLEEELKGVVGIEEVVTTSSLGASSIRIVIDDNYPNKDEVLQDIQEASLRVNLPSEVRDIPKIRQFKSSEKAILDVGVYIKGKKILDAHARKELQLFVLGFENQLLAHKEISAIERTNYLKPELQVIVDPKKILQKEISLSQVMNQIRDNNIRLPIGSLADKGESGVAPKVKILPLRIADSSGSTSMKLINDCIRYAADQGAKVINVSFTGVENRSIEASGAYARSKGSLLVYSAGNQGRNRSSYPDHQNVVIVGATTETDRRWTYGSWFWGGGSNYGPFIDIVAPGHNVYSTVPGNSYRSGSGTSFSAPILSGVAALVFSINPALGPAEVEDILYRSADNIGSDYYYGAGRVNAKVAAQLASETLH